MAKLDNLRQWRESNGLSRQDVADQFGVSAVTVWRWEAGERFPSVRYLPKLSKLTGISLEELMSGVGE
jgi:transcriptional regulator with XRE-family HTH domain